MPIDSRFFTHPSDRAALKALKAIPGFHQFMKAFMSVWNEKLFRIENMSSNLKVTERKAKKYHDMLIPICEKLGIEVPELYLKFDDDANAYTYGDTKPIIVVTAGLLERFDDDLVATVLAHECGHIACHHTLYLTIGRLILGGTILTANRFNLAGLITEPLEMAFAYWMRCSEFSADRAAIICDGNAKKMTELCMRFSGYDPRYCGEIEISDYLEQANEYYEMMKDSKVNKLMEFYQYRMIDHPLNVVRAFEADKWAKGGEAGHIFAYLENGDKADLDSFMLPAPDSSKKLAGQNYEEVKEMFEDSGFTNVRTYGGFSKEPLDKLKKEGAVLAVNVNGNSTFAEDAWFPVDAIISIYYKTENANLMPAPTAPAVAAQASVQPVQQVQTAEPVETAAPVQDSPAPQPAITQTVVQDVSNQPQSANAGNLYISYSTADPRVQMVTRIVSTGTKSVYVNGMTLSYMLQPGPQTIILKIGKINYRKDIMIQSYNAPVRIYASFNGKAQITVEQPPC